MEIMGYSIEEDEDKLFSTLEENECWCKFCGCNIDLSDRECCTCGMPQD